MLDRHTPVKVSYRREWIFEKLQSVGKVIGCIVFVAALVWVGWALRGTTIEPPRPPKPQIIKVSEADARKIAQRGADDMAAHIGKEQSPESKIILVSIGYCAETLRLKSQSIDWSSRHIGQVPGSAPSNVFSPLYIKSKELYEDATAQAKKKSGGEYMSWPKWVNTMCPYK